MSFDWSYAAALVPVLAPALWVTVQATLAGMAIALVLGLALAVARRSGNGLVRRPAAVFVEFVRGTPLLVQLYVLFFVLPEVGIALSPFATGAIGLGLHYATYCAEVYRAGIEGVPRGQWEAAAALNFSRVQTWRRIVLPQAIARVAPALGNYMVAMFKDTPLLSAITVVELLQTAKMAGSETFRYIEPMTLVGVVFLALSLVSAAAIRVLEARLARALHA
ncbi:MAG TPA: ectoine/hydroxyectoine ABC transporter permease subunit EhuD [Burkholderiales bacterium]|nr:ectoine/hydroxyectoine ABC transporter permease subunit EhuD [Burkholderiales bacterium]